MFNNSIDNKPFFTKSDGTIIRDLTRSMFNFTIQNNNISAFSLYKVPKQYKMRVDLISHAVYGDTKYAELILKFNGISNPLSINEGDIIIVPPLDMAKEQVKPSGTAADAANNIRKSYLYIDPLKIPKTSAQISAFDEQLKDLKQELPPNIAPAGEQALSYRNGRVMWGEGVSTPAQKCLKNGQTTSEFLITVNKKK